VAHKEGKGITWKRKQIQRE